MVNATAEYIMFCDQDDVWNQDKISLTIKAMKKAEKNNLNKAVLVHSDLTVVDAELNTIAESMMIFSYLPKRACTLDELLYRNNVTGCTVMINQLALQCSLPVKACAVMHDWWVACSVLSAQGVIVFIDKPLLKYRQHDSNSVGAKAFSMMQVINKLNCKYIKDLYTVYKQAKFFSGISFISYLYFKLTMLIGLLVRRQ